MKRISGGHSSLGADATLLSSHAGGPRTAAGDTSFAGQTWQSRRDRHESARRQPEDLPAGSDITSRLIAHSDSDDRPPRLRSGPSRTTVVSPKNLSAPAPAGSECDRPVRKPGFPGRSGASRKPSRWRLRVASLRARGGERRLALGGPSPGLGRARGRGVSPTPRGDSQDAE
jgi:hypothetical protein